MDAKIQTLQNEVETLQQKVFHLETLLNNSKYPLSEPKKPSNGRKTIQQHDYTFEAEKGPYLHENHSKVNLEVKEPRNEISKSLSEDSKINFKTPSQTQKYNLSSNQEKGLNGSNFIKFSQISEEEKIEIIKKGFQLQTEGKISLKKYYETNQEYSLFQDKGYKIKYESIRRTKLYQQLKP